MYLTYLFILLNVDSVLVRGAYRLQYLNVKHLLIQLESSYIYNCSH